MQIETEELVRRVLERCFEEPPPYSTDLSYDIIGRIQRCPELRREYEALGDEGTVNQWIGKAVRALTN